MRMQPKQPTSVTSRFFAGLTEYAFQTRLGIADPPLTDYLSDMLIRFVRSDNVFHVRDLKGRPLTKVADMIVEGDACVGPSRREVHRHIGDFILFWTGVYPEALRRLKGPHSKDLLVNYCAQGKRSYYIASTISVEEQTQDKASQDVLERLSDQFELCMAGLAEVRRKLDCRIDDSTGPDALLL